MIKIKRLTPDQLEDYLDFFDHRAFSDGSPFYPCYCSAFNMSRERIQQEFFRQAEINGGGNDGWKKALRDSAVHMVTNGEIQGYLAYEDDLAVGWCNANDRLNYCRVGEFDLSAVPPDEPCDDCQCRGQVKSVVCFEIAPEYRGIPGKGNRDPAAGSGLPGCPGRRICICGSISRKRGRIAGNGIHRAETAV